MSKAEKFIEEHTKETYNYDSYGMTPFPWLTPDQARKAVEIARGEILLDVAEWIKDTFIFSKDAKKDFSQTFNVKLL
jgi:hypothetical protein